MSGWLSRLFHILASLRVAVGTMVALAVACIAATFYESAHGTAATQRLFYRSAWFGALLAVLAASILFSALERLPWNRHHAGFVLAHAGILLLLLGSLVSLHAGLDGRLTLAEGETGARLSLEGEALRVDLADGPSAAVPVDFRGRPPSPGTSIPVPDARATLVVEEYEPDASIGDVWAEAMAGQVGRPALQFTLSGQGQPLAGWLMVGEPGPARVDFGPIVFSLEVAPSEEGARALLRPRPGVNQVAFVSGPGEALRYALSTRRGEPSTGTVRVGEPVRTPWMELSVSVDRFLRQAVLQRVVTRRDGTGREEDATPAVRLRLQTPAGTARGWVAFGESATLDPGGVPARVGYGPREGDLPFRVTLLDFHSDTYPGSRMAATYESRVRIEDPELGSFERTISMNRPLHHRGYTLFQASYVDGERQTSILSVSRAPGLPLVYLGCALLSLGALWMSFLKRWVARRQGRRALARLQPTAVSLAGLAAGLLFASAAGAGDLEALRRVAVQDGGRLKPLDTFARESARRISGARPFTGGESVKGLSAVDWVVDVLSDAGRWQREPIVRVAHAELREAVGLPAARDRFSYAELASHEGLESAFVSVQDKLARDEPLGPVDSEVAGLYETLALMRGLLDGSGLRIVPLDGAAGGWLSVADLAPGAEGGGLEALRERVAALLIARGRHDGPATRAAAVALRDELRALGGSRYPDESTLAREVTYNRLKPFRLAWMLELAAFLLLLASFPLASRRLGRAGLGLAALGLAANTLGLVLRTLVSGRAPVTNMYETVVFVAWGAVLLALVFEALYGGRVAATCASGLAVVALILADNVPILDGSIAPLVPVLRDNMWLTLHVLTITLGYAAFFLAMGLGHLNLGLFVFAPGRAALLKSLSLFLYRSLQVGTFFLAVGTLLGGVWASYSWGRFWGWDPKETWALIALLGYLAVLHGRLLGWLKDFGLAVGSIAGFLLVLMAWYGVNYVLGTGLHAYGFGTGGAGWMLAFAVLEMVIIVFALARRAQMSPRSPAPEPRAVAVP